MAHGGRRRRRGRRAAAPAWKARLALSSGRANFARSAAGAAACRRRRRRTAPGWRRAVGRSSAAAAWSTVCPPTAIPRTVTPGAIRCSAAAARRRGRESEQGSERGSGRFSIGRRVARATPTRRGRLRVSRPRGAGDPWRRRTRRADPRRALGRAAREDAEVTARRRSRAGPPARWAAGRRRDAPRGAAPARRRAGDRQHRHADVAQVDASGRRARARVVGHVVDAEEPVVELAERAPGVGVHAVDEAVDRLDLGEEVAVVEVATARPAAWSGTCRASELVAALDQRRGRAAEGAVQLRQHEPVRQVGDRAASATAANGREVERAGDHGARRDRQLGVGGDRERAMIPPGTSRRPAPARRRCPR